MSAKRKETRERRLAQLIDCSKRGERFPLLGAVRDKKTNAKTRADAQGVARPCGFGPSSYSFGGSAPSRFFTK